MVSHKKSPKDVLIENYYDLISEKQNDLKSLNKTIIKMDLHCHDLNSEPSC